jgi:hypothetical protein
LEVVLKGKKCSPKAFERKGTKGGREKIKYLKPMRIGDFAL